MKFLKKHFNIFLILAVSAGCTPNQDFPAINNPLPLKPALLNGTWSVQKVVQVDVEATNDGFPTDVAQRDITTTFPFADYKITFNLASDGRPGTYSVDAGDAPNFLSLTAGNWSLDDYVFTTQINLTSPTNVNASGFRIKSLDEKTIVIEVVRNDINDGTEYSYYEYTFTK